MARAVHLISARAGRMERRDASRRVMGGGGRRGARGAHPVGEARAIADPTQRYPPPPPSYRVCRSGRQGEDGQGCVCRGSPQARSNTPLGPVHRRIYPPLACHFPLHCPDHTGTSILHRSLASVEPPHCSLSFDPDRHRCPRFDARPPTPVNTFHHTSSRRPLL